MLQPPLPRSRLQKPNRALRRFGVQGAGLSERSAESVPRNVACRGGELDGVQERAVQVAVGVDDVGRHGFMVLCCDV